MKWTEKRHHDVLERGLCRHLHRVRLAHIIDQVAAIERRAASRLRILDAGCGDGVITGSLRESFPQARVVGVDADAVRLERARRSCRGVVFARADVDRQPWSASAFDVVICHHVIEHVPDDAAVLKECRRVLRPGGSLILGIPHEGGLVGRILRRLHRRLYAEGEHVNFYTIRDMRARLLEHGFTQVEVAKFGFLFPHYYVHLLLLSNALTFRVGHLISQYVDGTADSLIFLATKPPPPPRPESVAAAGRDDTRPAGRVLYDPDFGGLSQQESGPREGTRASAR